MTGETIREKSRARFGRPAGMGRGEGSYVTAEPLRSLVGMLRRTVGVDEPTDGELLRRFSERRDQDAFAGLVARHAPLVLGVCRRILGDHHHAEDAFQACFLVLAHRASHLVGSDCVAGFLHEVAVRIGRKQRARLCRAARRDRQAGLKRLETAATQEPWLDEELRRLPAAYRDALTLCYLRGLSIEEAAASLGCTPDGLRGRLHRGKQLLRDRLRREPPALPPVALPAGLCESTLAALSAPGPAALYLAKGVIRSMFLTRMIWPLAAVAMLVVAVPVALLAGGHLSPREAAPNGSVVQKPPAEKPKGDKEEEKEKAKEKAKDKEKGQPAEPEPPRPVTVREVKVKDTPFVLGDWNDARTLATADAVKATAKKEGNKVVTDALEEASGKVKFDRELLVVVGFQTGGPPYGKLKYKIDQKKREVEFYCEEPKLGRNQFRGFAQRSSVDFFAVPAGTKVKWGGRK